MGQPRNDERAQEDQAGAEPAQARPGEVHAERTDEDQDRPHEDEKPRKTHEGARTPPDGILGREPGAQGACGCTAAWDLRSLDCTCAWNEVISAVRRLAYGPLADHDIEAFAPVVAAMVHDAAYRARDDALRRQFALWSGTRKEFASAHGLDRSRLYQLGLHHQ